MILLIALTFMEITSLQISKHGLIFLDKIIKKTDYEWYIKVHPGEDGVGRER